jgi:chromate transport protein ChrA
MYAVMALVFNAAVNSGAALLIEPRSQDATATLVSMLMLAMASSAISMIGLVSTALYLSRRIRPSTGALVGFLCGVVFTAMLGLLTEGIDFSLVLYLAVVAPTLLAVLLASLLDRPTSGWQT